MSIAGDPQRIAGASFSYILLGMEQLGGSGNSQKELAEEWERRLAAEGMPAELEAAADAEEHTRAYDEAVAELEDYFLNAQDESRAGFGVHELKMREVIGNMKMRGATEIEIETMEREMDDFARTVEEAVADVLKHAIEIARNALAQSELLQHHPDKLLKIVLRDLGKTRPAVHEATIRSAAERAVGMVGLQH